MPASCVDLDGAFHEGVIRDCRLNLLDREVGWFLRWLLPSFPHDTEDVLFGDVWAGDELAPRDRSLITVAALIAGGNTEQLPFHLNRAKENGLTEEELVGVITHLAFYCGWPRAMSAITVAKQVFAR